MPEQVKIRAETEQKDDRAEIELFDPWEQRFKFERQSRLHPILAGGLIATIQDNDEAVSR